MSTRRPFIRTFPKTVLPVLFLLCGFANAKAADVSLAWDASVSENVSGYKVYMGYASQTYNTPTTIGDVTTYAFTGLTKGTYYFAVTAFDIDGVESDFSNEVSRTIGGSSIPCDINGDGSVNSPDLQSLANVILGLSSTSSSFDLNQDSSVNVLDLQILDNVILGLRSCP